MDSTVTRTMKKVLAWWEKAKKEAERAGSDQVDTDLYTFIETAKTPQALNNHWPELYELIKFDFKPSNFTIGSRT